MNEEASLSMKENAHLMGLWVGSIAAPTLVVVAVHLRHDIQVAGPGAGVLIGSGLLAFFSLQGWVGLDFYTYIRGRGFVLSSLYSDERFRLRSFIFWHAIWCWVYSVFGFAGAVTIYFELFPLPGVLLGLGVLTTFGVFLNIPAWLRLRVRLYEQGSHGLNNSP